MAEGPPAPGVVDGTAVGPEVDVGHPVPLSATVTRLTASNPSVMTGRGTNSYLIGTTELAVLDPGPLLDEHLDALEAAAKERGGVIRWIVVTHHHPDHAPAATALAERTGAPVVAFGHAEGVVPDQLATDTTVLSGPGFALRALHTPGHASDHLCWLLEDDRLLFSGDHVMQGSTVVIRPPDGNLVEYLASLERLASLRPALRTIAPGHGRLIGDPGPAIAAIVRHRLEREAEIVAVLEAAHGATLEELLVIVYGSVLDELVPVARHSLRAHLEKLVAEGRVERTADAGAEGPDEGRFVPVLAG